MYKKKCTSWTDDSNSKYYELKYTDPGDSYATKKPNPEALFASSSCIETSKFRIETSTKTLFACS